MKEHGPREHLPFLDDPRILSSLSGERYVVLRPDGVVSAVHARVRTALRETYPSLEVPYVARAHVTLTGFPKGTPLEVVQDLVEHWAPTVSPLVLETRRVAVFPAPFQIVMVEIHKTSELLRAITDLRERVKRSGLPDWPAVPPTEWVFHMSVAYCSELSAEDWVEIRSFAESIEVPSARCVVPQVEVAAFDEGREYSGGAYLFVGSERADRR